MRAAVRASIAVVHGGEAADPRADDLAEREAILAAGQGRGEPRVRGQLRAFQERDQAGPERGGPRRLERHMAPADLVHPHAGPRRSHLVAAVEHGPEAHVVAGDEGFQHGDVQVGARPGARAAPQGGHDGAEGVRAREHVGGLDIRGVGCRRVPPLEVHHARRGIDDVGEGGASTPGPGLTEAGNGAVDEVRLHRRQRRPVTAQARDDPRHEVLHRDVGPTREVEDHLARGGRARSRARLSLPVLMRVK